MNREPFRDDPIFAMRSALRGPDVPHDCFKDEIAIDFPSIGSLVDRVRASFLGDEAVEACGTLRRELRLSGREARWGAVVPLELAIRGTCQRCGGRGEVWPEPCRACYGSGDHTVHHPIRVSVPAGVANGARFRFRVSAPHARPVRVELRVAVGA